MLSLVDSAYACGSGLVIKPVPALGFGRRPDGSRALLFSKLCPNPLCQHESDLACRPGPLSVLHICRGFGHIVDLTAVSRRSRRKVKAVHRCVRDHLHLGRPASRSAGTLPGLIEKLRPSL